MARSAVPCTFSQTGPSPPSVAVRLAPTLDGRKTSIRAAARSTGTDRGNSAAAQLAQLASEACDIEFTVVLELAPASALTRKVFCSRARFGKSVFSNRSLLSHSLRAAQGSVFHSKRFLAWSCGRLLGFIAESTKTKHNAGKAKVTHQGSYGLHLRAFTHLLPPNLSLKRTLHSRRAWPGPRYPVHFRKPGQAHLPWRSV